MGIVLNIVYIIALVIIGLLLASLCMNTIFVKVRINKWIPLIGAIALFVGQFFIETNMIVNGIISLLCVLLFLWFMHIHQTGGTKAKEKPIVIKPKAKPNRVKHIQKDKKDK